MHAVVEKVTQQIIERSHVVRTLYLKHIDKAAEQGSHRATLACGNLAHGFAACNTGDKADLASDKKPNIAIITSYNENIAIITSYNDMLSAHEPYKDSPDLIKAAIKAAGGVAQVAGGVPAMCDGVTQGQPGMELSLFSRDVIAMSTAISLSHNMGSGLNLLFHLNN